MLSSLYDLLPIRQGSDSLEDNVLATSLLVEEVHESRLVDEVSRVKALTHYTNVKIALVIFRPHTDAMNGGVNSYGIVHHHKAEALLT